MELGTLVYEHADFILVNKPADVSVHKDDTEQGFIGAWTESRAERLWLVHRLDKMTSGLLLLARSQTAAAELSRQFADRKVDKLYLAISRHKPKRKQGMISGDMEPARRGSWKLARGRSNPARTEFICKNFAPGYNLILCHPLTGRTHQIRVALKSEGSPILGDSRYESDAAVIDRGYLHAWQLGFRYQGAEYCLRADPDSGEFFDQAIKSGVLSQLDLENLPSHWSLPRLRSTEAGQNQRVNENE